MLARGPVVASRREEEGQMGLSRLALCLAAVPLAGTASTPVTLVMNWAAELQGN